VGEPVLEGALKETTDLVFPFEALTEVGAPGSSYAPNPPANV
jgi:hypothetical protein